MRTNAPIVVGVDGTSAALEAVRWAAAEAELHGTRLVLVTAVPDQIRAATMGTPMMLLKELVAVGKGRVNEAEKAVAGTSVNIDTEVAVAHPAAMLLERSRSARMVVLGSAGEGDSTGGLIGSVRSAVAHHALCPVVVVHPREPDPLPRSHGGPVVVGVDGSEQSGSAIAAAFREAALRGADLVALHVWADHPLATPLDPYKPLQWPTRVRKEVTALSESLSEWSALYPEVEVQWVLRADQPLQSLREVAAHAQLLVVGSRGRGGFASLMLGSTSRALLKSAPCPVMVAPHTADIAHQLAAARADRRAHRGPGATHAVGV